MAIRRVRWAEFGGYGIALGGLLALISIAAAPGTPYILSTAVMGLALAPVMVGFYELGGRTPLQLARVALTISVVAVVVFSADLFALAAGLVSFDESRAASGALAIAALSMIAFGTWLVGAPAPAGSWLPTGARWLGVVCGLGWVLAGVGLLLGGANYSLTYLGGIGYQLLFPIWGLLIGRCFAAIRLA